MHTFADLLQVDSIGDGSLAEAGITKHKSHVFKEGEYLTAIAVDVRSNYAGMVQALSFNTSLGTNFEAWVPATLTPKKLMHMYSFGVGSSGSFLSGLVIQYGVFLVPAAAADGA